jgi:hypothetical protein
MNDAIAPDGATGGPSPAMPTIEYQPIEMEVDSVATFGESLLRQAENVGTVKPEITAQLNGSQAGDRGLESSVPVGGGLQDLTVYQYAIRNVERMDEMSTFLSNVETGLRNLGKITQAITAEYGSQDALNGADIGRINEIITGGQRSSTGEA